MYMYLEAVCTGDNDRKLAIHERIGSLVSYAKKAKNSGITNYIVKWL